MATVRFFTKGTHDPQTIYVRLRDGRTVDVSASTRLTISPDHWSKKKGWISPKANFHNKLVVERELKTLENLILQERNDQVSKGLQLNRDWLENVLHKWQGRQIDGVNDYLTDLIEQYIQELPNKVRKGKKGVTLGTLRNYNTSIRRIQKFEVSMKKRFRAIDIDLKFHEQYLKYAENVLGLAQNSIGRDIRNIKTVCLAARDKGIKINDQTLSRNFAAPVEKTSFTTLSVQELDRVKAFSGAGYLENARDWLLIGCWTGCRVGDLMRLNIESLGGNITEAKSLQYKQSKTQKLVNVPLHPDVREIITRLDGFPRPISAVKFNLYIKEVCRKSGLTDLEHGTRQNPETHLKEKGYFEKWQLIKSHTCRRSFATNHYSIMSNKQIMAVTGHATEKMLLEYIGETEVDHIDDFLTLWNNGSLEKAVVGN